LSLVVLHLKFCPFLGFHFFDFVLFVDA
jgi:hypothetical protein